jgi:hypothetical protein
VSDDIEELLRSGLAEKADTAPVFDDPGLADLAIAGAGRIRRRRRIASAASGAGLLVLGAAVVVWQPWALPGDGGDGVTAADTSTVEVQSELDMEFVYEDGGTYNVLNQNGDSIALGDTEPNSVFKLADSYLADSAEDVWTVSYDGETGLSYPKPSEETYTVVNGAGDQFALITPTVDYESEVIELYDVTVAGGDPKPVSFTTAYAVTLADWNATTAVFTADLNSVTGGDEGTYYFNDDLEYGLDSVAAAGFESALLVDTTEPTNVCVSDLDPEAGTAGGTEQCGPVDSGAVQDELVAAAGDAVADPAALADAAIPMEEEEYPLGGIDLGEFEDRFYQSTNWTDPNGLWQLAGDRGDRTWLLIDDSGERPTLSELAPPTGTIMPVLSYT